MEFVDVNVIKCLFFDRIECSVIELFNQFYITIFRIPPAEKVLVTM
jgi:hypothetical protein